MGCDDNYLTPTQYPEGYGGGVSLTLTCRRCWTQVAFSHTRSHDQWHIPQPTATEGDAEVGT